MKNIVAKVIVTVCLSSVVFSCSKLGRSSTCYKEGQDTTITLYGVNTKMNYYPVTDNDYIQSFSYANEGAHTIFQNVKNTYQGFQSLPFSSLHILSTILYRTESKVADTPILKMVLLYVQENNYLRTIVLLNNNDTFTVDSLFYSKSNYISSNDIQALGRNIPDFTGKVDIYAYFSTSTDFSSTNNKSEFQEALEKLSTS